VYENEAISCFLSMLSISSRKWISSDGGVINGLERSCTLIRLSKHAYESILCDMQSRVVDESLRERFFVANWICPTRSWRLGEL